MGEIRSGTDNIFLALHYIENACSDGTFENIRTDLDDISRSVDFLLNFPCDENVKVFQRKGKNYVKKNKKNKKKKKTKTKTKTQKNKIK